MERVFAKQPYMSRADLYKNKYLPDLDGNGGSGRFFFFLQSACVPIKSTLFTEWHTQRIVPWVHYIPFSHVYTEIYSIIAYYSGLGSSSSLNGGSSAGPLHQSELEEIAEEGRKWSLKTIRAEDMEIYLYRLLLEWGRVIRDEREVLGYDGDGSEYLNILPSYETNKSQTLQ